MKRFHKHLSRRTSIKVNVIMFGAWITVAEPGKFTIHDDCIFLQARGGTYILPRDGSYVRYISNGWYNYNP